MKYQYLTSIIICIFTAMLSVGSYIMPDKATSEVEGRTLQQKPWVFEWVHDFSILMDGQYFKNWDNYVNDQLVGRDSFVNGYTHLQKLMNRRYINGVYLGEDDYLFSVLFWHKKMDDSYLKARADYFNYVSYQFPESQLYLVNLPDKEMVYANKVPIENYESAKIQDMETLFSYVNDPVDVLNMQDVFEPNDGYYHKTDHHWAMDGTYEAYRAIISMLQNKFPEISPALEKDDFTVESYPNYFIGSEGRKINQLVDEAETLEIWKTEAQEDFIVEINNSEGQLLYDEHLSTDRINNDYMVYMNGDNPKEVITNPNADNDLTLVLFGDSMSNPLVGMLANHVKTIYSYDLRWYTEPLLEELKQLNPDMMMMIGLTPSFLQPGSVYFELK